MDQFTILLGVGALLTPIVIAAFSRDRTLFGMLASVKDDTRSFVDASIGPLNDRIDRVRNEYVRRDDLADHLNRIEKRFDTLDDKLEDIRDRLP